HSISPSRGPPMPSKRSPPGRGGSGRSKPSKTAFRRRGNKCGPPRSSKDYLARRAGRPLFLQTWTVSRLSTPTTKQDASRFPLVPSAMRTSLLDEAPARKECPSQCGEGHDVQAARAAFLTTTTLSTAASEASGLSVLHHSQ